MAINWARVGRTAVRLGRQYGPTVAREVRRRMDGRGG
ncbi:MAG TPA: type II toxin-antitoxin system PemK/MazF family toxin, partial [Actinomycetales bacterium]|nr:type II toxin-antitoxin system PemK/MazF family toxin [Actinomycetales bacterium]